jgi:hypothetical protein
VTLTKIRWYSDAETIDEGELLEGKLWKELKVSEESRGRRNVTEPPARKTI